MGAIEAAAGMADAEIVDSPPLVARHQSESGAKPATSHTPTSSQQPGTGTGSRENVCNLSLAGLATSVSSVGAIVQFAIAALGDMTEIGDGAWT